MPPLDSLKAEKARRRLREFVEQVLSTNTALLVAAGEQEDIRPFFA
jgi:hypothetical protein